MLILSANTPPDMKVFPVPVRGDYRPLRFTATALQYRRIINAIYDFNPGTVFLSRAFSSLFTRNASLPHLYSGRKIFFLSGVTKHVYFEIPSQIKRGSVSGRASTRFFICQYKRKSVTDIIIGFVTTFSVSH